MLSLLVLLRRRSLLYHCHRPRKNHHCSSIHPRIPRLLYHVLYLLVRLRLLDSVGTRHAPRHCLFCRILGTQVWSPEAIGSKCAVTTWLVHSGINIGTEWCLVLLLVSVVDAGFERREVRDYRYVYDWRYDNGGIG